MLLADSMPSATRHLRRQHLPQIIEHGADPSLLASRQTRQLDYRGLRRGHYVCQSSLTQRSDSVTGNTTRRQQNDRPNSRVHLELGSVGTPGVADADEAPTTNLQVCACSPTLQSSTSPPLPCACSPTLQSSKLALHDFWTVGKPYRGSPVKCRLALHGQSRRPVWSPPPWLCSSEPS